MSDKQHKESKGLLIGEYEKEVTYDCPIRGKVTQKIIVKKYKAVAIESKFVMGIDDMLEGLDTPLDNCMAGEETTEEIEPTEDQPQE